MDDEASIVANEQLFSGPDVRTETTTVDEYVYEVLFQDHIRLLRVVPENGYKSSTSTSCEIQTFPILHCPSYAALSYTWGRKPDQCTVLVNGQRKHVRKNLWRFLHHTQHLPQTITWLWIDALCINQSSPQERAEQVAMMPQIYRLADHVIIWLGPAYGGGDEAVGAISRASRHVKWNKTASGTDMLIAALCWRPYWTRMWILQELVLAKRLWLMCGTRTAPFAPLRQLVLDLPVSQANIQRQIIKDSPAASMLRQTGQKPDSMALFDLIIATQDLQCVEPRDRVYALLGIASTGVCDIVPDYQVSLSALLNAVLRNHHSEVIQPSSIDAVEDQCRRLNAVFVKDGEMTPVFNLTGGTMARPGPEAVSRHSLAKEESHVTLWWTTYHMHPLVTTLLLQDDSVDLPRWLKDAVDDGNTAATRLLIEAGVGVHISPDLWGRLLSTATANGHVDTVQLLLATGAQPNTDAIYVAADRGHVEVFKLLLDGGADINAGGYGFPSPLYAALSKGHLGMVEMLLERGAHFDVSNHDFDSIMRRAAEEGNNGTVAFLLRAGVNYNAGSALHLAVRHPHVETVKLLLDAAFERNTRHGIASNTESQAMSFTLGTTSQGSSCQKSVGLIFDMAVCDGTI